MNATIHNSLAEAGIEPISDPTQAGVIQTSLDQTSRFATAFRILCIFGVYMLSIEVLVPIFGCSKSVHRILRFIPYCIFLVAVGFLVRPVMRADRKTLLMASFLACVFLFFLLDITRDIRFLNEAPIFSLIRRLRADIQSFLEIAAIFVFLAGSYFTLLESQQSRQQLFRDMKALQLAQEALRDSEERFRSLSNASLEGIMIHEQGIILDANQAFARLFGYDTPEELIGKNGVSLLLTPESGQCIRKRLQRQESGPIELSGIRKDGSRITVETESQQMKYRGFDARIVSCRDISERKCAESERQQLQSQLIQSQKMEAFGQLASGVAHDFNNILTVIQAHISLMQQGDLSKEEGEESVCEIAQASERAASLTRQLLMFSRRQVMQPREFDLNAVVENMTKMLQRLIGEHIHLTSDFAPGGAPVFGDIGMSEQVIMNLVVNARDAMPKGGCITLATSRVDVPSETLKIHPKARPGCYVRLTVRDTGTGIASEHLPHIFEPFFTTKEPGKGTGLGLATVYGIVEQHQGWIEVESQVGRSTAFHVHLPFRKSASHVLTGKPTSYIARGGTETILLVEDEAPLRMLIRRHLERFGYRVLEADCGPAAVEIWQHHHRMISLLMTDMVMPGGMSGSELAERLQKLKPDLKILYSTGYGEDALDLSFPALGDLCLLRKPYGMDKMVQTVRNVLDA